MVGFVGYRPGEPAIGLSRFLSEGLQAADPSADLGFAYVTRGGIRALRRGFAAGNVSSDFNKRWVVGLRDGITEPAALRELHEDVLSDVRVCAPTRSPNWNPITDGPRFHAKLIALRSGSVTTGIWVGSMNATGAAMAPTPKNFEAGIYVTAHDLDAPVVDTHQEWWDSVWHASMPVTESLIDAYARVRNAHVERNPDHVAAFEEPEAALVGEASQLWIEAGAMSGGARNQVEFARDVAAFFHPDDQDATTQLRIKFDGGMRSDRPLTRKTTTFGVRIWRLSLPTEAQGGPPYAGRIIRLERGRDSSGEFFQLEVAEPGDSAHSDWQIEAHRLGVVGSTGGGRKYGAW